MHAYIPTCIDIGMNVPLDVCLCTYIQNVIHSNMSHLHGIHK